MMDPFLYISLSLTYLELQMLKTCEHGNKEKKLCVHDMMNGAFTWVYEYNKWHKLTLFNIKAFIEWSSTYSSTSSCNNEQNTDAERLQFNWNDIWFIKRRNQKMSHNFMKFDTLLKSNNRRHRNFLNLLFFHYTFKVEFSQGRYHITVMHASNA